MIALSTLLPPRLRLLPSGEDGESSDDSGRFPTPSQAVLASEWPELDEVLPDHGFPKGVVELTAPHGLGGATSIALAAVRAAHKRDLRAYCAWVDTEATLFGPGVAKAGVDLERLLVVRPPPEDAGRIAAKVAESHACEVIVVDLPRASLAPKRIGRGAHRPLRPEVLIRKLALATAQGGSTLFLVTDKLAPRDLPWPVALRLELDRAPGHIVVKVAKEKRGRVGARAVVPMNSRPGIERDVG
jgi:recombination protein RecA